MNDHKGNTPVSLKNAQLRFFSEYTDAFRNQSALPLSFLRLLKRSRSIFTGGFLYDVFKYLKYFSNFSSSFNF